MEMDLTHSNIAKAMFDAGEDVAVAAEILGVKEATLVRRIKSDEYLANLYSIKGAPTVIGDGIGSNKEMKVVEASPYESAQREIVERAAAMNMDVMGKALASSGIRPDIVKKMVTMGSLATDLPKALAMTLQLTNGNAALTAAQSQQMADDILQNELNPDSEKYVKNAFERAQWHSIHAKYLEVGLKAQKQTVAGIQSLVAVENVMRRNKDTRSKNARKARAAEQSVIDQIER